MQSILFSVYLLHPMNHWPINNKIIIVKTHLDSNRSKIVDISIDK